MTSVLMMTSTWPTRSRISPVGAEEFDFGEGSFGEVDAGRREVRAVEAPAAVAKVGEEGTVAATEVENLGAWRDIAE